MTSGDLALNLTGTFGVAVDIARDKGPLELWRHTFGRGGINANPLSERVAAGMAKLRPRLVRIFLQEYFRIYPEHGVFDWSRLDPFMDSMAKTGAKVLAAIAIKPRPLYPKIDQKIWRPTDVKEWQRVIAALVKRYSVDRQVVSHWSIGNEIDIGENGGCPFLISDPKDYAEYYAMTAEAILSAAPQIQVGGPAVANAGGPFLPEFIEICRRDKLPLDFIAWHLYMDDPERHAGLVKRYAKLLDAFSAGGGKRPEMMVTECNKGFDALSVEDLAFEPRRAANIAAILLAMIDAGPAWSFYYHFGDQVCYVKDFAEFFDKPEIMYHHWNEVPHRFGLFGVNEEVRPQYFVYQLLARMGERRVEAASEAKDVRVLASSAADKSSVLLVNFAMPRSEDRVATVRIKGLKAGLKQLRIWRIDNRRTWCGETLELAPVETRAVDAEESFEFQVLCPSDSVALVELTPVG